MPIRIVRIDGIEDGGTNAPTLLEDADAAVAYVASNGRLYWRVEGITYYVNGTGPSVAPMIAGAPIGLLLSLTYPTDSG